VSVADGACHFFIFALTCTVYSLSNFCQWINIGTWCNVAHTACRFLMGFFNKTDTWKSQGNWDSAICTVTKLGCLHRNHVWIPLIITKINSVGVNVINMKMIYFNNMLVSPTCRMGQFCKLRDYKSYIFRNISSNIYIFPITNTN